MSRSRETLPFGSWHSPLTASRICEAGLRLSLPRLAGDALLWLEGRPREGGRQVLMAACPGEAPRALTPDAESTRTRVHEYGGGDYAVHGAVAFWCRDGDGCVVRQPLAGGAPVPLTDGTTRHADLVPSPDGRWLVAVEERPIAGAWPENRLVALPTGGGASRVVAAGFDFVSSPVFSPRGDRLLFLSWSQPDMPWDATVLWEVAWGAAGPGERRRLAGGDGESIFQPGYSPEGVVSFVSDRSGWWNLEQLRGGARVALCRRAAEFGRPQWTFGQRTWGFLADGRILCARTESGRDVLGVLDPASGTLRDLALPWDAFDAVAVQGGRAALLAASAKEAPCIGVLDVARAVFQPVRRSSSLALSSEWIARPQPLRFPTGDGETAHAFLYEPTNPDCVAPTGARPPLLVKCHGGPTGATTASLQPTIQFFTSRGFAVIDVDYRGSTGYGRAYRDRLRGDWGVVDVQDCVEAARWTAAQGRADPSRLAIRGSSAGGYTVLCALAFHDAFAAGASYYGIGDLEALVRDTHKFEARYVDGLVGPYPERRDLYRARSPLHHTERLSCPVIFFQGLEDRVVPPQQAEAMVAALAARGIPHAYLAFPAEQHGFRSAEHQRTALEAEHWFYGRVLDFPVGAAPAGCPPGFFAGGG